MTARGRLMRAWRVVSEKRDAAVHRRMRNANARSVDAAVSQLERDGHAWLDELGADYGHGDTDALMAVAAEVDRITAPNLLGLAQLGALSIRDLVGASISAGFASGYYVRAEIDRQERDA